MEGKDGHDKGRDPVNFAGQVVCGFRDTQTAGDGIELAFNG